MIMTSSSRKQNTQPMKKKKKKQQQQQQYGWMEQYIASPGNINWSSFPIQIKSLTRGQLHRRLGK
jgi:hypothetical protein